MVEPHGRGQPAEDLGVGQRLAGRVGDGLVQRHVVVAVGRVQVEVLGLHRRRQHDVGEVARVRPALLQHRREEVLAQQPGVGAVLVGHGRRGVRVEDHQRGDRRVGLVQRLGRGATC